MPDARYGYTVAIEGPTLTHTLKSISSRESLIKELTTGLRKSKEVSGC